MLVELKDRAFEERAFPSWARVDLSWELQMVKSSPWDTQGSLLELLGSSQAGPCFSKEPTSSAGTIKAVSLTSYCGTWVTETR